MVDTLSPLSSLAGKEGFERMGPNSRVYQDNNGSQVLSSPGSRISSAVSSPMNATRLLNPRPGQTTLASKRRPRVVSKPVAGGSPYMHSFADSHYYRGKQPASTKHVISMMSTTRLTTVHGGGYSATARRQPSGKPERHVRGMHNHGNTSTHLQKRKSRSCERVAAELICAAGVRAMLP